MDHVILIYSTKYLFKSLCKNVKLCEGAGRGRVPPEILPGSDGLPRHAEAPAAERLSVAASRRSRPKAHELAIDDGARPAVHPDYYHPHSLTLVNESVLPTPCYYA